MMDASHDETILHRLAVFLLSIINIVQGAKNFIARDFYTFCDYAHLPHLLPLLKQLSPFELLGQTPWPHAENISALPNSTRRFSPSRYVHPSCCLIGNKMIVGCS
jgi:hypothetical protein